MRKYQQVSESLPLVILLTLSGGFMDAYSYICRGHVFANAQTGNMLLFGVSLSTGNFSAALLYLIPVLAFALGIAASEIVRYNFLSGRHFHWRQVILLIEAVILFAAAFLPQDMNLLANSMISFACGAQVESFQKVNGSSIATTMCIGNLRAATQALCVRCLNKNKKQENGMIHFGIISVFVLGAVIGNFCVKAWGEKAIIGCSILLLISFTCMLINREN